MSNFPAQSQVKKKKLKGQLVRRCPIFRAQSQAKSKKTKNKKEKVTTSQIVLYTYITFTPRKFCTFVWGRGAPPPPPPPTPGYVPASDSLSVQKANQAFMILVEIS